MSQDRAIDIVESCYRQLASDGAALRRWQKQYIEYLDAAHAADLAEVTARYAAQRRAVEAQRQTQHATADAVLAQKNTPFTRSGSRPRLRRNGLAKAPAAPTRAGGIAVTTIKPTTL